MHITARTTTMTTTTAKLHNNVRIWLLI